MLNYNIKSAVYYVSRNWGICKTYNNEITPLVCPFCQGGDKHDKNTFSININTGAYNCQRGKCAVKGSIFDLFKHYDLDISQFSDKMLHFTKPFVKKFQKPKEQVKDISTKVESYLSKRGISKQTIIDFKIKETANEICFDFYENKELVFRKFRNITEKKFRAEEKGKPVFYNIDNINPNEILIIVEGEIDCLSVYESGLPNVISLPSGVNALDCVNYAWDTLQLCNKIIIMTDNDEAGQDCKQKLIDKLGDWKCFEVNTECACCKDANEILLQHGKDKLKEVILNAKEIPYNFIVKFEDIKRETIDTMIRFDTGFKQLNNYIGGFQMGSLAIMTGYSGAGKSTITNQFILSMVQEKFKVMVCSSELKNSMFKNWLMQSAAGKNNLVYNYSKLIEDKIASVELTAYKKIEYWLADNIFLTSDKNLEIKEDDIIKAMNYCLKRFDCRCFIIDNLMTIALNNSEKNNLEAQKKFVLKLKAFVNSNNVFVLLIAHPRKQSNNNYTTKITKSDIAGSSDIVNLADLVLSIYRFSEKELEDITTGANSAIDILKNRLRGKENANVQLNFDYDSKRFDELTNYQLNFKYDWQTEDEKDLEDIPF